MILKPPNDMATDNQRYLDLANHIIEQYGVSGTFDGLDIGYFMITGTVGDLALRLRDHEQPNLESDTPKPFFAKITGVKPPFRQEVDGVYLGKTRVFDNVVAVK